MYKKQFYIEGLAQEDIVHSKKLIRAIGRISSAKIAQCEDLHLLDFVDGEYVGVVKSRFLKQLAALLTGELIKYSNKYSGILVDDLPTKEVLKRRHAEARMAVLEDMYYFELEMAVLGKLTHEQWLRFRTDSKILKGWEVWICNAKKSRLKGAVKNSGAVTSLLH